MSEKFVIPQATIDAQRKASDPCVSAWVSANAGSGKTKVLADRVVRLLLNGTPPGRILCLTFTKAAAANMALKVVNLLSSWVTMPDVQLTDALEALEGRRVDATDLAAARRLFARAVETPGGLKIETIHAFCERILHLAPLEANVPAQFKVLEESGAGELITQALADTLAEASSGGNQDLAQAWEIVSGQGGLSPVVEEAIYSALKAAPQIADLGGHKAAIAALRATFALKSKETPSFLITEILDNGFKAAELDGILAQLDAGKATDQERAASLRASRIATYPSERLAQYCKVFFDSKDKQRSSDKIVTRSVADTVRERLMAEADRVAVLRDRLRSAEALERTDALFRLMERIGARYEAAKNRLGMLDFDDMIRRALAMLERGDAAWVLYKLDRGIDHVLIDEAQDTNPEQWRILRRLTGDFSAGFGAAGERRRTVFAVGDPQQSLYGFQGAAPQEFEASGKDWSRRIRAAQQAFASVNLTLSFRSTLAVLSAVDATFHLPENYSGLSFDDSAVGTVHASARPHAPGQVELWPLERPSEPPEPDDAWAEPVDVPEATSPAIVAANRVAHAVRTWITEGDETGRRWKAGDILILVRKRNAAFEAVIRALKTTGVPVAGQDRLNIGEHIAVMDLISAGRAALLPQNDLALAEALKSPLVGFDDDDLLRIAATRAEADSLADALQRAALTGDRKAETGWAALQSWRNLSERRGPFGFYAALLGPGGGRVALIARLGHEAADTVDAFLSYAQNAEYAGTPSLAAFLERFSTAEHVIKRDLEAARDEVRVMTVHGAKGLEAPLVVVLDGSDALGRDPPLIPVAVGQTGLALPVWQGASGASHSLEQARALWRIKGLEEHRRLLYVAMTRAGDRLVIAPYLTDSRLKEAKPDAWSVMIRHGLAESGAKLIGLERPYGPVELWRACEALPPAEAEKRVEQEPGHPPPQWLCEPLAPDLLPARPLSPSRAFHPREKQPASPDRQDRSAAQRARLKGMLIHELLERLPGLPPADRARAAALTLAIRAPRLSDGERTAIAEQALAIIDHPDLAALFVPGSLAEAEIAGQIAAARGKLPVSGRIDRLSVADDQVLIADFKTDARPPTPTEAPNPAVVTQLALYRALLQEIYPDRPVRAYLVFTTGPVIRELSDKKMGEALAEFSQR